MSFEIACLFRLQQLKYKLPTPTSQTCSISPAFCTLFIHSTRTSKKIRSPNQQQNPHQPNRSPKSILKRFCYPNLEKSSPNKRNKQKKQTTQTAPSRRNHNDSTDFTAQGPQGPCRKSAATPFRTMLVPDGYPVGNLSGLVGQPQYPTVSSFYKKFVQAVKRHFFLHFCIATVWEKNQQHFKLRKI